MSGRAILVGCGPGDPELLTVKAVRAIATADLLLVDDLVNAAVLDHARPDARIVRVGKRGGCASTPQAFIERLMVAEVRAGRTVARLKGGDPFVFGRGGEEVDALRAAGLAVEVVSGITAGIAAPAAVGVPVTDRRHAAGVILVTGHAQEGGRAPDWAALARTGLTLVIYMGVAQCAEIADALIAGGLDAGTPAVAVQHAHSHRQRSLLGSLGTLAADIAAAKLGSPAILVIGDVVRRAQGWQTLIAPVPATMAR